MNDAAQNLEAGALGLGESITMGVAGTAPAYSIEITRRRERRLATRTLP